MYSVVIPCYNSAHTIRKVVELTENELKKIGKKDVEFILINDCSKDNGETLEVLRHLAMEKKTVKVIDFAKNFGQHNATMAGLRYAKGDIIISMDDDMQTHPSQLKKMFEVFDEGYDLVYGYYPEKKSSLFRKIGSWFNRTSVRILLDKPKDIISSSFWIARRFVCESITNYTGAKTYLLGLILRATRNIKSVPVEHFEREYGKSNYSFKKLFNLYSNILGFSEKPLELIMLMGNVISFGSFAAMVVIIVRKILDPGLAVGWPSLMVIILFALGMILLCMGLVGEYIGRIYLSLNNEPQYVIREKINIEEEKKCQK